MAQITREDVAHVARLARLQLTDVEALDVGDVPPTSHPYPLQNVLRPDERRPSLDRDAVLAGAPDTEAGQFRVPPVLGEEP